VHGQIEKGAYHVTAEGAMPALTKIKKAEKAIGKRLEAKEEASNLSQAIEAKIVKTLQDMFSRVEQKRGEQLTRPLVARWVSEPPARDGALPGGPEAYFELFCLPGHTVRVHCTMDGFERVLSTQYDPQQPDQANLQQMNIGSTSLETFEKINALLQERLKIIESLRFIVPSSYTLARAGIVQHSVTETPEEVQGKDKEVITLPECADEEYGILPVSGHESLSEQIRETPFADMFFEKQLALDI
jgi:hypothetical protein